MVAVDEFDSKITNYYKEHYDRYELSQYKIPNIEEDLSGDEGWPEEDKVVEKALHHRRKNTELLESSRRV